MTCSIFVALMYVFRTTAFCTLSCCVRGSGHTSGYGHIIADHLKQAAAICSTNCYLLGFSRRGSASCCRRMFRLAQRSLLWYTPSRSSRAKMSKIRTSPHRSFLQRLYPITVSRRRGRHINCFNGVMDANYESRAIR